MRILSFGLLAAIILSACASPAATQQAAESDSASIIKIYRPPT